MQIVEDDVERIAQRIVAAADADRAIGDVDRLRQRLPLHVRIVLGLRHEEVDVLDDGVGAALRDKANGVGDAVDQFKLGVGKFRLEEIDRPVAAHIGERVFRVVEFLPIV